MNAQYTIQQGTVGVSRPKGRVPGVPFLTHVVPSDPYSQKNLTRFQLIPYYQKKKSLSINLKVFTKYL